MSENNKEFIGGFYPKPKHEKTPTFIHGKGSFNVDQAYDFFKAKITDYKIMASIFNLLENPKATPLSIVDSKVTLLEHITERKQKTKRKKGRNEKCAHAAAMGAN